MGLEVVARDGPCGPLTCSFPLPVEWPEQKILKEVRKQHENVTRVKVVNLDGVRQAQFKVARLRR